MTFPSSKVFHRRKAKKPTRKPDGECRWFLLCKNEAVTTKEHPFLGAVPICQSCDDKLKRIEGKK